MKKKIQLYPNKQFYSRKDLEIKLKFRFLSQIAFETFNEKKEIKTKGMHKLKNNEIDSEILELGKKFIKEIQSAYIPNVSIRLINKNVGYGLFTEENLPKGVYVGEYTGIIRKNNRRHFEPLNNYCYEYPILDHIARSYVIDATQGNLTRFINHSYNPNLKPFYAFFDGFYHLIFLTIHNIKKNSELTYDYGKTYWYIRKPPIDL